jgi:hypothetical protein
LKVPRGTGEFSRGPRASSRYPGEAIATAPQPAGPEGNDVTSQLPQELRDFIAGRAGYPAKADIVQRWVVDVMAFGATYRLGTSKNSPDGLNSYLMLDNLGVRHFGAFAYVHPAQARVELRLSPEDADGFQHATHRNVENPYKVIVSLTSDEAYKEALQLARKALEQVQT